jgi:hypothetical protein
MAVCERHGIYLREGTECGKCWSEGAKKRDIENKSTKSKPTKIKSLKDKAQSLLSKRFKEKYCKSEFINCWICSKPVRTKGSSVLNTTHCSHYYPKSIYWELAFLQENLGACCYDCNVNNPEGVPAMRAKLIQVHGEEKIKELDLKANKFMIELKTGQKKSQPSDIWLMAQIEGLKKK